MPKFDSAGRIGGLHRIDSIKEYAETDNRGLSLLANYRCSNFPFGVEFLK